MRAYTGGNFQEICRKCRCNLHSVSACKLSFWAVTVQLITHCVPNNSHKQLFNETCQSSFAIIVFRLAHS